MIEGSFTTYLPANTRLFLLSNHDLTAQVHRVRILLAVLLILDISDARLGAIGVGHDEQDVVAKQR
jgi:hypothetical protein